MPITLTPELAHRMLAVWERRQRYPKDYVFDSTVLEAALGLDDTLPAYMTRDKRGLRKRRTKWPKRSA